MDAPTQERPKRVPKPLIDLLGQKLKADLDPADPIFIVVAAVDELLKKANADLGELVTNLADQVSAANVMAEASAKANAEKVITEAAAWSARKIDEAGDVAVARINDELHQVLISAASTIRIVKWAAAVAVVCSVAALAAAASTVAAIFVG